MMKNFISYILVLFLIIASFYYADKISSFIINKSDLMTQINSKKSLYERSYIDAIKYDEYIIPGLNGQEVNTLESFYNMKKYHTFLKDKLVYNEVSPKVSIEQNKHLIINKANPLKKSVAILVKNNDEVLEYSKNLDITKLINLSSFSSKTKNDQINIDIENYDKVNSLLDKNNMNKKICLIFENYDNYCKNKDYYIVKPTFTISNNNIYIKDKIQSGDILYISDDLSLDNYKILLITLNFYDLKVISLSKLISEKL